MADTKFRITTTDGLLSLKLTLTANEAAIYFRYVDAGAGIAEALRLMVQHIDGKVLQDWHKGRLEAAFDTPSALIRSLEVSNG